VSFDDLSLGRLVALEDAPANIGLAGLVEHVRAQYGLANIAYVCPGFRGYSVNDPFVAGTYSHAWVQHYRNKGYARVDPVFQLGVRAMAPIDWAELPRDDKKVQQLFAEAQEAGIGTQGMTIPVRGPVNSLWALFCLTTMDSDSEWAERRNGLMRELLFVAQFVHQRAADIHGVECEADLGVLTRRETEVLQKVAEGASVEDAAIALKIGCETVKTHLDSARVKLGALNRNHAVSKALRAGLIS
jgi:LuxR family quorum-sensing system transcriptional regulator SinR